MQPPPHGTRTISQADFGRMKIIGDLPAAQHSNEDLVALAAAMISSDGEKDGSDDEENPFVPAGYTYLGQFIDHDLTFDTVSNFGKPETFAGATNMRTPRFDLDNVYGRGPDDQPYLYQDSGNGRLLLGEVLDNGVPDVMRNLEGRAIIGDPRNDENAIVTQIQSAFIRFHNSMVDRAGRLTPPKSGRDAFEWARMQTRHHYQRIILDDYMPRIIRPDTVTTSSLFSDLQAGRRPSSLLLYDLSIDPYMPLEFAVAAYRFGHSMIRPGYRLNNALGSSVIPTFSGEADGLRGFQRLAKDRGIDWELFFSADLKAGEPVDNGDGSVNNAKGTRRTQYAYKIDTMLVKPLGNLPEAVATMIRSLAERNLKRGLGFGLPSGQAVARAIGANVLEDRHIEVRAKDSFEGRKSIASIKPAFAGNAPLWFYVLAEAERHVVVNTAPEGTLDPITLGTRLGPVGGAIVAETFVGLMLKDSDSVLNLPDGVPFTSVNGKSTFSMVELLQIGSPASALVADAGEQSKAA